jgi:hypothetical protein
MLSQLLQNQEFLTDGRVKESEEMMVVAYIQATTQIMLNMSMGMDANDTT